MRVLLDENLPVSLARVLQPHDVSTVSGLGWSGVKNGELLRRTAGKFDVLIKMDRNLRHQQQLANQPFGVILVRAASNRMSDLSSLVPAILAAISEIGPGELRRVGA